MAGKIPQNFIDELVARSDIVDIVGQRVKLKRQGREYIGLCPFHSEKTPSFTLSQTKQFYHCFGCGAHGTVIGFLMHYEHLAFPDAVRQLAARIGYQMPEESERGKQFSPLYDALSRASAYYQKCLHSHPDAMSYLKERGVGPEIIKRFQLGYAPGEWQNLSKTLKGSASDSQHLVTSGLALEGRHGLYDRFRDRIMFPIADNRGRIIAFGGRARGQNVNPKYLNSPETPIFHKGEHVYGLYEARQIHRKLDQILVVEGYMDVVILAEYGIDWATACLGTAVTEHQINRLFQTGASNIVFCFDGDAAGQRAAWRAVERCLPVLTAMRHVSFTFLPDGEDPDSYIRGSGRDQFEKLIHSGWPLSRFLFHSLSKDVNLSSAEGRAALAGRIKPLVARIRDPVYREAIISETAERTRIPLHALERAYPASAGESRPQMSEARNQVQRNNVYSPKPSAKLHPRVAHALELLLHLPEELGRIGQVEDLKCCPLTGIDVLTTTIETLRMHPNLSTAGILETWRDSPHAKELGRLAARERLIWDDLALACEYEAVLAQLASVPRERELAHLQKLAEERELTSSEQTKLMELLRSS